MTDIGMTENKGESGLKFEIWFRRRRHANDKAYTLHCKNSQVKKEWTTHISKLLWQQAYKSKGEFVCYHGDNDISKSDIQIYDNCRCLQFW